MTSADPACLVCRTLASAKPVAAYSVGFVCGARAYRTGLLPLLCEEHQRAFDTVLDAFGMTAQRVDSDTFQAAVAGNGSHVFEIGRNKNKA